MKFFFFLFFSLGPLILSAQVSNPPLKHSISLGFERVGLDGPDGIGNRYLARYARHLFNDRLVVEAGLGYMSVLNRHYIVNDFFVDGEPRKRVTTDLTFAFDFLRMPRHAFRIGAGPSLWYRKDQQFGGGTVTVGSDGTVSNVRIKWYMEEQVNYGFNVLIEYEYAITQHLTLAPRVSFASLERAGQSSIYGLNLGYRLLK